MATRQKTAEQRAHVEAALRESLRSGTLSPGEYAPSVRGIAQRYGVSSYLAHQVLQTLAQEGAFLGERGRGTRVGRSERSLLKHCLIVTDEGEMNNQGRQIQTGFEDRIAQLGGVTGLMSWSRLLEYRNQFPVSGLLQLTGERFDDEFEADGFLEGVTRVRFANKVFDPAHDQCDFVSFDDFGGGLQTTKYLLGCGHKRIAFLGLHAEQPRTHHWGWSRERENGWREALKAAGLSGYGLAFGPSIEPQENEETATQRIARDAASLLLEAMRKGANVSAVVAANDAAALALLDVLAEANISSSEWPVLVGFDNSLEGQKYGLTSLRLPWEEVGRAAADLLWTRAAKKSQESLEPSRHAQIAMRLIPRLTCGSGWAHDFKSILPDTDFSQPSTRDNSFIQI